MISFTSAWNGVPNSIRPFPRMIAIHRWTNYTINNSKTHKYPNYGSEKIMDRNMINLSPSKQLSEKTDHKSNTTPNGCHGTKPHDIISPWLDCTVSSFSERTRQRLIVNTNIHLTDIKRLSLRVSTMRRILSGHGVGAKSAITRVCVLFSNFYLVSWELHAPL